MLADKLVAAILTHRMFSKGDVIVVAVSGGPDSVALLHFLWSHRSTLNIELHVAHLDHELRGAESAADAAWVASLADSLGVPATIASIDVNGVRRSEKLTLEQAARLTRYRFLAEVTGDTHAVGVAVGHTADDQVETVVMHWLRGAGVAGLRGMRAINTLRLPRVGAQPSAAVRVFRPMLEATRAEVMDYLRAHGLRWRRDASNEDVSIQRNRVRFELIPAARRFNPKFDEAVLRSARAASADDDYLADLTHELWPKIASSDGQTVTFDRVRWNNLPRALRYRVLREGARHIIGDLLDLSATHLDDAVAAIENKPAGTVIVWPRGLRVVQRYSDFQLRGGQQEASLLSDIGEALLMPGVTEVGQGTWQVATETRHSICHRPGDRYHADVAPAVAANRLAVRRRRPGDRFHPAGMRDEKKLQDFFVDRKVPRDQRDTVPLLVANDKIAWVVGWHIAEWAKVGKDSGGVICLTFSPSTPRKSVCSPINGSIRETGSAGR